MSKFSQGCPMNDRLRALADEILEMTEPTMDEGYSTTDWLETKVEEVLSKVDPELRLRTYDAIDEDEDGKIIHLAGGANYWCNEEAQIAYLEGIIEFALRLGRYVDSWSIQKIEFDLPDDVFYVDIAVTV